MKDKFTITYLHKLRWKWKMFLDKTGRLPIYAALIPLVLAFYWLGILQPQTHKLETSLNEMQQQLHLPLPLLEEDQSELQSQLSVTEYQQIRIMFDIFSQFNLQVESGNYRMISADENKARALTLLIPLRGDWLSLARALRDISRTLPVDVEMLQISRPQPDTQRLSITLQLILRQGQS